jgi:acyl phosphate:glycerol-3-phosphate acyltransferase
MNYPYIFITLLLAYLLGSIPTAVWYGRAFFGLDIREQGSGNAGATNTFRVFGKKAGTIVLLIDVIKGWIATKLADVLLASAAIESDNLLIFKIILGLVAVIGHLYPVFAQFKGGKGVATSLGMILAIQPQIAGVCMLVFLVVLIASKYVSLSSMISSITFPALSFLGTFGEESLLMTGFGAVLSLAIIVKHRANIRRIANGIESKSYIFGRKTKK